MSTPSEDVGLLMCGAVKLKVTPEETCCNTLWKLHFILETI